MTSTNAIDINGATSAIVAASGDWGKVSPDVRVALYRQICDAHGMDPLVRPIDLLKDRSGRLVPYVNKSGSAQIVDRRKLSIEIRSRSTEPSGDWSLLIVEARASDPSGRFCDEVGVVELAPKATATDRANAWMKARTKAGRRAVLGLVGLGMLDELEVLDAGIHRVVLDVDSGEVIDTTAVERAPKVELLTDRKAIKAIHEHVKTLATFAGREPKVIWSAALEAGKFAAVARPEQLAKAEGLRLLDQLADSVADIVDPDGEIPEDDAATLARTTASVQSAFPGTVKR